MFNTSIADYPKDTQEQHAETQIPINVDTRISYNESRNVLEMDQILQ
jgi:hypothetical protein